MAFYFNKAINSAPFSSDFSKSSFVSGEFLLANVTLLYSMLAKREKKRPWVLNMESHEKKSSKGKKLFRFLKLHLSVCCILTKNNEVFQC